MNINEQASGSLSQLPLEVQKLAAIDLIDSALASRTVEWLCFSK